MPTYQRRLRYCSVSSRSRWGDCDVCVHGGGGGEAGRKAGTEAVGQQNLFPLPSVLHFLYWMWSGSIASFYTLHCFCERCSHLVPSFFDQHLCGLSYCKWLADLADAREVQSHLKCVNPHGFKVSLLATPE